VAERIKSWNGPVCGANIVASDLKGHTVFALVTLGLDLILMMVLGRTLEQIALANGKQ